MDELKLLKTISDLFPAFRVHTGIGDDSAVIEINGSKILITVDSIVEKVHFYKEWLTPFQLGRRSLIINISDISAMGGMPEYGLIAVNMGKFKDDELIDFFRGIRYTARKNDIEIIGGNISSSSEFSASITMIGKTANPILRSGAKAGDLIVVTGTIGDAAAGMEIMLNNLHKERWKKLIKAFIDPPILTKEASQIARFASAMIDVSDGLLIDIWRIINASNCGGIIDTKKIPRSKELKKFCKEFPSLKEKILWGGEDYQLLFTIPRDKFNKLQEVWNFSTPLTIIGEITQEKVLFIKDENGIKQANISGWVHQ